MLDFEKRIASGEIQSSGLYGPALDGGKERRAFAERESAYTSYDPATNIVKFYDPEGNVTQEGQRTSSGGGVIGGLMTGFNQTVAQPDFQKAVMLAALATAGGAALGVPGIPLDALPATSAGAAPVATAGTTAGLLGSPFAPAASAAGSSAGYLSAAGGGIGSTLAGLGGSPFAPAASAAGSIPGYVSATGVGTTGLGSVLEGLGGSPFAPAGSAAASMPGYVGAAEAGGGLLSTLGNAASSLLPSASTASSFLPSLITGGLQGLGAANTAEKAREAAQIQAAAQVEAARIAADAAKFRPVGVTTRFGASNFTTDAQGNVIGAGYTASPEIQAYQNRLSALAAQGLTGAEGAQAAYAPLTAGAQSLFNLGQGYIQQTPEQQAADYIAKQQALLAPGQQQQLAQLQNTLQAQGRGGLSVAQGGTGAATLAANNVVLGNGTSAPLFVAPGTNGNILTSNGTTWTSAASSAGNGGATITSSGTDVTLTTSSTKVQQITMTATGLAVVLPSTAGYTTGTVGTPIFTITNAGSNYFDIENSTGFVVFGLNPGETCTISLTGNTTQNQWVGDLSANGVISSTRGLTGTITTTVPTWSQTNQNIQVTGLSSTLVVAVWTNSTTGFTFASAGSISGSTITWGTPTSISSARAYQRVAIAALSGTTALIESIDNTGNAIYFNGISVSGTTITVSTISAGTAIADGLEYPFLPLTSTTAIALFSNTASGVSARVITYNGASAPSLGAQNTNGNAAGPNIHAVALNSTTVLCVADSTTNAWSARIFSISGSTITFGTNLVLSTTTFPPNSGVFNPGSLIAISATEAIFAVPAPSINVQKFTVSGTTITASTVLQMRINT